MSQKIPSLAMPSPTASNQILKRSIPFLLLAFLLLDTGYSFLQHLHLPMDGDLAPIVFPSDNYKKVLTDPFGLGILKGERYSAPNRFFIHFSMSKYLRNMPLWLQSIASPVDSIYLACALFKTMVQLLIISTLAAAISIGRGFRRMDWLIAAGLVMPFFQTNGYSLQMGILEKSVTYAFFYPYPLALLLVFLLPFFQAWFRGERPRFTISQHLLVAGLTVALPFSGPLVPAVLLLVCPVVLLAQLVGAFRQNQLLPFSQKIGKALSEWKTPQGFYFIMASLLSLWSLYVGTFNLENIGKETLPLLDRYPALLRGCGRIFTQKLGLPLLTLGIFTNLFLVSKFATEPTRHRIFLIGKWLGLFILAYLLLLPLGGYRGYRSLIVRHDTIMPVSLGLIFFYGLTAFALLRNAIWPHRRRYAWGIVVFSMLVTSADLPDFQQNACEKAALETIASSKEEVVKLEEKCSVISWTPVANPGDSRLNAELLYHWQVTDRAKLYYSD